MFLGVDSLDTETTHIRDEIANDLLDLPVLISAPPDDCCSIQGVFSNTCKVAANNKKVLDQQVQDAGLCYRGDTPMDGNCFYHAISDQLERLGQPHQSHGSLRENVIMYLRDHPRTPDGTHYSQFINHHGWNSYLRRMRKDGEWADWIIEWAMSNMLNIDIAIISSTGSTGLRIVTPHSTCSGKGKEKKKEDMILLGHEAEIHYYSLDVHSVIDMKTKYGEGRITTETCPKCNKEYESYSSGVHEIGRSLVYYSSEQEVCDKCLYEEFHPEKNDFDSE